MYKKLLSDIETEKAVMFVKTTFTKHLAKELKLLKISSPLLLTTLSGLNDALSGTETPVTFATKNGDTVEIPQSLAKWKRNEIHELKLPIGQGIWTNMKAIRQDENDISPYHSLYVEQFDWEVRIAKKDRTLAYLKKIVKQIYKVIKITLKATKAKYPVLTTKLPEQLTFITSEELRLKYPTATPRERETLFAREAKAFFIIGVGHKLSDGFVHGARAADYDDWKINGDLILYNKIHDDAIELSSMGIRVDGKTFKKQKELVKMDHLFKYDFHKMLDDEVIPSTIGGGVGQSRLVLFILEQFHIGEFQRAYWPKDHIAAMKKLGVILK